MPRAIGRYLIHDELASGGMATVHLASLNIAEPGFSRIVAAKILHAQYGRSDEFRTMFLDEARLVSQIRHANVASTLDILDVDGEIVLIMDYVDGPALSALLRAVVERQEQVPIPIAVGILVDVLEGMHAAHEAVGPDGTPLGVVHRDISPQNVLVGFDGVSRVVDFGVAKSLGKLQVTAPGDVKGKASYMAPEQVLGRTLDRRVDIYAAAVVLWEMLTATRLFTAETSAATMFKQLNVVPPPPSATRPEVSPVLDAVVARGLSKSPEDRFPTARDMAEALAEVAPPASQAEIARWVSETCGDLLAARRDLVRRALEEARTFLATGSVAGSGERSNAPAIETVTTATASIPQPSATLVLPRARESSGRESAVAPSSGKGGAIWVGAIVATLGVVGALAFVLPRLRTPAKTTETTAVAPPPTIASPPATPTESAPTPTPSATPSAAPVDSAALVAKPPVHTHRAAGPIKPASPSTPTPSEPAAPKNCCAANGLRLRFNDCVDNCPK